MFIDSMNELFRLDLDVVKFVNNNLLINFHNFIKYFQVWEKCKNKSTRSLHGLTSILINDVCTLYFSNGANMLTFEAERIVLKYILFNQLDTLKADKSWRLPHNYYSKEKYGKGRE